MTHGFPFEIRRIIKSTSTAEYAEYIDSDSSATGPSECSMRSRHKFAVTRMRSWVVSANVPHECDVARCAGGARARRAWPRVATALAAYTFLVTRLNADLARLVLALVLARSVPRYDESVETIDAMVT